jgi:fission process protein 1
MFDEPVEHAVEWVFHKGFETVGGPSAVGHSPETGREARIDDHNKKIKEKEL